MTFYFYLYYIVYFSPLEYWTIIDITVLALIIFFCFEKYSISWSLCKMPLIIVTRLWNPRDFTLVLGKKTVLDKKNVPALTTKNEDISGTGTIAQQVCLAHYQPRFDLWHSIWSLEPTSHNFFPFFWRGGIPDCTWVSPGCALKFHCWWGQDAKFQ